MQVCTIEFGQVASRSLWEAFQPVTADNKDVFHPTVGKIGAYLRPEGSTFFLGNPQSQDVFDAVKVHPDCHIRRLVNNPAAIADFNAQCVQENDRVELISLAVLPDHDFIQDGVSNCRNRLMGDINPHRRCHVVLDIPNGHPTGIQANNHLTRRQSNASSLSEP